MTLSPEAFDLCVIGAGSGGLSVAAGASQMGARVVLIEKHKMGGDCLNYGCVPSKALLAAGHAAWAARGRPGLGVAAQEPVIDGAKAFSHVASVIKTIEPMDSVERFEGLGVTVVQGAATFLDGKTVEAGTRRFTAKRFIIATGSRAFIPPIPGLDETPYLTNETLFDQTRVPEHLIVLGAGPIGLEMAQAHRQLGARVTVFEMARALPKDDPELAAVTLKRLRDSGIEIREGAKVTKTAKSAKSASGVTVTFETEEGEATLEGSHLLVATGRQANVDGLGLEAAGVRYSPRGIEVDARLRSSNKKIFAIGDVAGGLQFTHVAGYHAGIIIRNVLFRMPAKANHSTIPWVTYTDPELAQVGLTEADAKAKGLAFNVLRWSFAENDRAQAEGAQDGMIKVIVTPKGKILGAGIAGKSAGELIQTWVLAMTSGLKIGAIAGMVAPYPTLGEVSKRAAGSFYTPKLFSDRTRSIVRFLLKFG